MNYGSEGNNYRDVTPEDVKRFLQSALSPEDFQRVEEMLTALCKQAENENGGESDLEEEYQQDQPPPDGFSGLPRTGSRAPAKGRDPEREDVRVGGIGFISEFGGQGEDGPPTQPRTGRTLPRPGGAQDGMRAYGAHLQRAEADYARRWPETKRIQHAFDAGGSRRPAKVSSAAYADYARRWGTTRVL